MGPAFNLVLMTGIMKVIWLKQLILKLLRNVAMTTYK